LQFPFAGELLRRDLTTWPTFFLRTVALQLAIASQVGGDLQQLWVRKMERLTSMEVWHPPKRELIPVRIIADQQGFTLLRFSPLMNMEVERVSCHIYKVLGELLV
jgi:hypothetical protein